MDTPSAAIQRIITPEDLELAEYLHTRDPRALPLLLRFTDKLEAYFWSRYHSSIARDELTDLILDTIYNAHCDGAEYKLALASPYIWLRMRASYAISHFRRSGGAAEILTDIAANRSSFGMATETPSKGHGCDVPSDQIEALLAQISPRRADAVRLYYYDGLTIEDIGQRFAVLPNSVRVLLSRACKDLRDLV